MTDESGFQMKFDETLFYYEFCCQCVKDLLKKKHSTGQKSFSFAAQIISTLRFNFDRYSLKH